MAASPGFIRDPFVRRVLQFAVVAIAAALAVIPCFIAASAVAEFAPPGFAQWIINNFFSGELTAKTDIATLVIGAAPSVVRAVCYTKSAANAKLNSIGKIVCVISIMGILVALFVLYYLSGNAQGGDEAAAAASVDEVADRPGPLGSAQVYQNLTRVTELSMAVYVFYLTMFFGISEP